MAATERNAEKRLAKSSLWDHKLFRLELFVTSYIAAYVVSVVLLAMPHPQKDILEAIWFILWLLLVLPTQLLVEPGSETLVCFGGWLVFGGIAWAGTLAKSRRVFAVLVRR